MDEKRLREDLTRDEARRAKPYTDTVGKISIGVGRNLTDVGLRPDEIDLLLSNDISAVCHDLDARLPWWRKMTDARQNALANMCFNLGITRLLTFKTTLGHLERGEYDQAADAALQSKWATQVGDRAKRIAALIKKGVYD